MKHYENILFDLDGCLVDSLGAWLKATRAPLETRNIKVSDEQIITKCLGRPAEGFTELGVTDPFAAVGEMEELANKLLQKATLHPQVHYVLTALSKRSSMGLVTSTPKQSADIIIDKHKLRSFFSAVITQEDTLKHKPNDEPLQKALIAMKGRKTNAVMIGDSSLDVMAAASLGIDSILFYPKAHKKFYDLTSLMLSAPTHIVNDLKKILEVT